MPCSAVLPLMRFAMQWYCWAWLCALVVVRQVEPTMFLTGEIHGKLFELVRNQRRVRGERLSVNDASRWVHGC